MIFVDETGVNLLISVSLKINTERQVKGKFGHVVQSGVCREPYTQLCLSLKSWAEVGIFKFSRRFRLCNSRNNIKY